MGIYFEFIESTNEIQANLFDKDLSNIISVINYL